jgi:hypothetical protein
MILVAWNGCALLGAIKTAKHGSMWGVGQAESRLTTHCLLVILCQLISSRKQSEVLLFMQLVGVYCSTIDTAVVNIEDKLE